MQCGTCEPSAAVTSLSADCTQEETGVCQKYCKGVLTCITMQEIGRYTEANIRIQSTPDDVKSSDRRRDQALESKTSNMVTHVSDTVTNSRSSCFTTARLASTGDTLSCSLIDCSSVRIEPSGERAACCTRRYRPAQRPKWILGRKHKRYGQ